MADMLPGMPVQSMLPTAGCRGSNSSGDTGGALGRLAIFSAWLDVGRKSLHQYVHADRDGNRRGVFVQSGGDGFPEFFPRRSLSARMGRRRRRLYFEAAAAIITLVLLGQVLELRARSRTGAAIRALARSVSEKGPHRDGADDGTKK